MNTYEELIKQTALADERIVVMTAENRAVVRNLPSVLGDRFIDTGITEQCMIGTAAGLALRGRIPICHALSTFLVLRAYEFIRTDAGIGQLPVKLSSWIAGFLSDGNGPTHQALEDVALMRGIPGMQVFCPANNEDMLLMLPQIWASPYPSYVRLITRPTIEGYTHDKNFQIGKAEVVSEGTDITLMTYGFMFDEVYKAKALLEAKGLSVGMLNMRSLKPFDGETVLKTVKNSKRIVTIEDHFRTGGLYSILAEFLLDHQITAKVKSIALDEHWFRPARLNEVLEYEGFTAAQLAENILQWSTTD